MKNHLKNVTIHLPSEYVGRSLFFEHLAHYYQNGVLRTEPTCLYYLVEAGQGMVSQSILVVLPPHHSLQSGRQQLCLTPIMSPAELPTPSASFGYDEGRLKRALVEKMGCPSSALFNNRKVSLSAEGIWAGLFSPNHPRVFRSVLPCTKEELKKVGDVDEVVAFALHNDVTQDERLVHVMKAQIPKVNMELVDPNEYMLYAPNGMVITNTKTGKTTVATHISPHVIHNPTVAYLLGWSSSDHVQTALLDNNVETVFVDEYTEMVNKDVGVSDGLLSFMEQGVSDVARGRGNKARGACPLVFMGNPSSNSINDLVNLLRSNIAKITTNPSAFGSRIGVFMFTDSAKTGKGFCPDAGYARRCQQVLRSLQLVYADYFSSLFRDDRVVAWLSQPFDEWYIDALNDIASQCQVYEIQEFIRGQKAAHKHVRGASLHIAFVDSYKELVANDRLDVDALLSRAQEILSETLGENVSSFKLILKAHVEDEVLKDIVGSSPPYIQHLILNLNRCDVESSCVLDWLENGYVPCDRYKTFDVFKIAVTSSAKCNLHLTKFGLALVKDGDRRKIIVVNPQIWQNFRAKRDLPTGSGSYKCGKCGQVRLGGGAPGPAGIGPVCPMCDMEIKAQKR